jgi:type VI protein secretion system component Hcp
VTVAGVATGDDTAVAFNYGRVTETIKGQNPDGSLDPGQSFSYDFRETGASITPIDHDALANFAHSGDDLDLTYLLKIEGIAGDSTVEGYEGYFAVDAYTFGVLSQLSGGTGGGGGAGRAEFDPLMVNLAGLPPGLATLMADAATGRHIQTIDLVGLNVAGGENSEIYHLKLNDVTVAGVATGDDTAVAFNYGRVTETIKGQNPDGSLDPGQSFSYDFRASGASITPVDHDALANFAHSGDGPDLTYLLKIDGIAGESTVEGYEGYFAVDAYTFGVLNQLAGGTGGGGGAGRATFDPLMVDLAGLPPGLATLMADAATGRHIPTIDLVGLNIAGDQTSEVYHLKLGDVTVGGVVTGDDTAVAFNYDRVTETIKGQNPDGSLDPGQTFSYDFRESGASINPVDHDALAAFAHTGDGPELTYLLKVDGIAGDSTLDGYEDYFTVDAYTFGVLNQLAGGTGGGGAVGRAEFDPLLVNLAGLPPGLATLMADAATGRHIQTIDLVGLNVAGGENSEIYHLKLNDVTVAGVATGDDTAVAFNYGRVTETIKGQNPDGSLDSGQSFSYDFRESGASITPVDHDALASFAHSSGDSPELTYLLKIDGIAGDSTLEGYEDYFAVDAYTFGVLSQLSGGTGGGGGVGRAEFDPLMVDLASQPPGVAKLMADAATGRHIQTIDLVGLNVTGDQANEVYHLKLNDVTVAGVVTGNDTGIAFNYDRVTETIKGQNPDGSLDPGQSFSYDFRESGASINPVDHDELAAFTFAQVHPHAHGDYFIT